MIRNIRRNLVLIALAALAGGCATGEKSVTPWASRQTAPGAAPAPTSGILFKLNVDADMQGLLITQVDLAVPLLAEIGKTGAGDWQRLILTGDQLNKFPNDVVLLPLVPGEYFGMSSGIMYRWGTTSFVRAMAGGAFEHFNVPPGKIVDLGALDISVKAGAITKNAAGLDQRGVGGSCNADNSAARKLEVVEAALARPEADKLGWRDALEAARRDVLAAGDFGNEYLLKSWPSRAPAPGLAEHPATGALFRLKIDDTGNAFAIRQVTLYFPTEDQTHDSRGTNWQRLIIPGSLINKSPNDVILVPLPAGPHAASMEIEYQTSNKFPSFRLWGDFERFDVQPGKITVLEDADLKFAAKAATMPDGSPGTRWNLELGRKDAGILKKKQSETPEAKRIAAEGRRRAVADALAKPEAESLRWKEALEAAKASLAD